MSDQVVVAAKLTKKDIENAIASTWFINGATGVVPDQFQPPVPINHPLDLVTFCVIVTKSGCTVTGESVCANRADYSEVIGREEAHKKAFGALWDLLGFANKHAMAAEPQG